MNEFFVKRCPDVGRRPPGGRAGADAMADEAGLGQGGRKRDARIGERTVRSMRAASARSGGVKKRLRRRRRRTPKIRCADETGKSRSRAAMKPRAPRKRGSAPLRSFGGASAARLAQARFAAPVAQRFAALAFAPEPIARPPCAPGCRSRLVSRAP
ncbi:hypothetical protein, partial [Burkholderia thailandensis]|uniref:hypothetical protein n=1 Tax=Burkholderia thailandensis TaxID=57975 RepID=UPI0016522E7C